LRYSPYIKIRAIHLVFSSPYFWLEPTLFRLKYTHFSACKHQKRALIYVGFVLLHFFSVFWWIRHQNKKTFEHVDFDKQFLEKAVSRTSVFLKQVLFRTSTIFTMSFVATRFYEGQTVWKTVDIESFFRLWREKWVGQNIKNIDETD